MVANIKKKLKKYDWTTLKNLGIIVVFIGMGIFLFCGEYIVDKILEPSYCTVTETSYDRNAGAWAVTIRDGKGNYWEYLDDDYRSYGEHIYPIWGSDGVSIVGIEEE